MGARKQNIMWEEKFLRVKVNTVEALGRKGKVFRVDHFIHHQKKGKITGGRRKTIQFAITMGEVKRERFRNFNLKEADR